MIWVWSCYADSRWGDTDIESYGELWIITYYMYEDHRKVHV